MDTFMHYLVGYSFILVPLVLALVMIFVVVAFILEFNRPIWNIRHFSNENVILDKINTELKDLWFSIDSKDFKLINDVTLNNFLKEFKKISKYEPFTMNVDGTRKMFFINETYNDKINYQSRLEKLVSSAFKKKQEDDFNLITKGQI